MAGDTAWDPAYAVGHALIDAQHHALLDACQRLADTGDDRVDDALAALKRLAREHFDSEVALLAERGDPGLDDHIADCEEFGYLVDEVATPANFDRAELQRFLALWFVGHIVGSAARLRGETATP